MEEILKEVKSLDAKSLREKLLENGVKVGPIAPSSISLFQKRLANEIFRQRGGVEHDSPNVENEPAKEKEKTGPDKVAEKTLTSSSNVSGVYYAVCLPENTEDDCAVEELVFADKDLALKTAKKYTGSRFKVFKSEQDAKVFSRLTAESAFQSPRRPSKEESPAKKAEVSSESSVYKAPKPQEVTKLRKAIESGDVNTFKEEVWKNPRFLVSSGDTPTMYQEGTRYTAMHMAAIKNKPEICQAILNILENPEFVNDLYCQSKHTEETQNSRINFLVDLYLNMPDKGCGESPLHMACKFGHEKVVEILAAHPKTDRQLKNKFGEKPNDIICSRCSSSSETLKKRIEELLQGQCYVPLMRSEDNTLPPVIGQPWSPDISKTNEMPRISNSPREPSMYVRACAGPMSPTDAGLFHKRWTTPPSKSQSPEQAKTYFNIKRSDCEKGMERIGRQLAHDLQIPWSEYWEFLDQFVDLSTSGGLDLFEYYLKKRVWLTFVKEFKEKCGISEDVVDFTGLSTPVVNPLKGSLEEDANESFDSMFTRNVFDDKKAMGCDSRDITNKDAEKQDKDVSSEEDNKKLGVANVLSPMSELSKCFAELKMDDSWSERATIDTSDKSEVDDRKKEKLDATAFAESDEGKDDSEVDNNKGKNKNTDNNDSEQKKAEEGSTDLRDSEEDTAGSKTVGGLGVQRLQSLESESTASYETAAEDVSDGEHTFASQLSEPENIQVVIRLKDGAIITKLVNHVKESNFHSVVNFVVQLKDSRKSGGMKVNIVSIPEIESALKLFLLEDIEVSSYDGDISTVQEGEIVELGTSSGGQDEDQSVMAYLTRTVTLPKTKYIYGPQPTREDLNVSRALSDVTICPELHPNVFHWKISLSRFLRDTNYRWQSPAKLQSKMRQSSPQPSPLGKTGIVNQYGSPFSVRGQSSGFVTSDVRTKLFPSIME